MRGRSNFVGEVSSCGFREPAVYRRPWNLVLRHNLRNGVRTTRNSYPNAVSPIVGLGAGVCPATVFRGVISSSIDTVDAVLSSWPGAHVFQKRSKRRQPFGAYTHTCAAVVAELPMFRVQASAFHRSPAYVFWAKPRIPSMSMHCIWGAPDVQLLSVLDNQTTATFTGIKYAALHNDSVSAIAFTLPQRRVFRAGFAPTYLTATSRPLRLPVMSLNLAIMGLYIRNAAYSQNLGGAE